MTQLWKGIYLSQLFASGGQSIVIKTNQSYYMNLKIDGGGWTELGKVTVLQVPMKSDLGHN